MNEAAKNQGEHQDDEEKVVSRPIKLHRWQRTVLGTVGVALVGVGGWSQIAMSLDGAGTVAFVVSGAVVGVVGVVGWFPNRISGRDYTAHFGEIVEKTREEVQRGVGELVDTVAPDALPALREAARDYEGVTVGTTTVMEAVGHSIDQREQFEQECREYLLDALPSLPVAGFSVNEGLQLQGYRIGRDRLDSSHGVVFVDAKVYVTVATARRYAQTFEAWRKQRSRPARLIVLARELDSEILRGNESAGSLSWDGVEFIQIRRRGSGQEAVTEALRRALDSVKVEDERRSTD